MPIPGEHDRPSRRAKPADEPIERRDHLVPAPHAEGPAGAEVVLHVHDEEDLVLAGHGRGTWRPDIRVEPCRKSEVFVGHEACQRSPTDDRDRLANEGLQ